MNIGNLLNDQSPKTAAASLPDLRPLNDPQLAPESAGERRTMSMNTSHHVGSHPNYSSAAYSYQTPPSISAYPQLIPGGYSSQSQQMLAAPQGPPSLKQEGSAISAGSDMRAASSTHHESEGKSPEDAAPRTSELPKNFACSTCGKGFARRSDLVRHGTMRPFAPFHRSPRRLTELVQNVSIAVFARTSAPGRTARNNSSSVPHSRCMSAFTRERSLTCARSAQRHVPKLSRVSPTIH